MSELTYLEINVKIATITGVVIEHITGNTIYIVDNETGLETGNDEYMEYNPRTDDALWAQLIIKHEVSINFNFCLLNISTDKFYEKNFHDIEDLKVKSLELIIEAHNG